MTESNSFLIEFAACEWSDGPLAKCLCKWEVSTTGGEDSGNHMLSL